MYIEPNTTIKLIFDCPLDGSYENTLWFETIADQTNYFINTLGGYTLQKNTYQRVNKGVLRVAKSADDIYNCNYMAFRNDNYLYKWFYAFIDKIEYVNNVTAEITYHLDLLQTWHFAYQVEQCFVEREHSSTDEIGDNIVDEGLDTGEYISDDLVLKLSDAEPISEAYDIVIWGTISNDPPTYTDSLGYMYITGAYEHPYMYSGLKAVKFPLTRQGIEDAMTFLNSVPAIKRDGLLSMNIQPRIATQIQEITVSKISQIEREGGPIKNNKLYTYPYNFLYVTNNAGNNATFRYEFFNSGNCYFSVYCDETPTPTVMLTPRYYKGVGENFDETLELTGFPQIAFTKDSFQAWLAQNASSLGLSAIAALLGVLLASNPGTALGIASSMGVAGGLTEAKIVSAGIAMTFPEIKNIISGGIQSFRPPQSQGRQGSVASVLQGTMKYGFMHKHITKEYATIIDDYFNMFGYACRKVKVPNRESRPEWNYVKTAGCKIRGSMPSDDAVAIEKIYDSGIRFWKNPGHIGNYTFDNSPTVVPDNPNVPSEG